MTIHTLRYIHDLLVEDEKKCRKAMELVRHARNEAEATQAENLDELQEVYHRVRESWSNADDALRDFESQAW